MIIVILTMGIIAYIILSGFYLGTIDNWDPFFPYGVAGIFRGSATIFFAYVGFDAVATAAEEAKNPKRVKKKDKKKTKKLYINLYLLLKGFTNWYSCFFKYFNYFICISYCSFNFNGSLLSY